MFKTTPPGGATLWLDVSTLLGWKGRFTGIPRTLSCLLEIWLADEGLRLGLCRFDAERGLFHEVARGELGERLAANVEKSSPPAEVEPAPRRVRDVLKGGYGLLPAHLQEAGRDARRLVRHLIDCVLDAGRAVAGILRRTGGRGRDEAPPCPFAAGDVLLLAGGGWDEDGFGEALGRLKRGGGLSIATLFYDFIPLKYPQFFPAHMPPRFEAWARQLLRLSDLILTISENSRRDIASAAREGFRRLPAVEVIRLGDELPRRQTAIRPGGLPPRWRDRPFVLVPGTVEVRKNHYLLYHVWRRLVERHGAGVPPLIFAGRAGWLTVELLQQVRYDPALRRRILHLDDVNDAELRWLYQHCLFTLYPSHYEGWGLPVAESLAHGKYCIGSDTSSLPEIAGDLIDYHDPVDALGCLRLVERALFEPGFLAAREERIRREFRITSWRACADTILRLLARYAGDRKPCGLVKPDADDPPIPNGLVA